MPVVRLGLGLLTWVIVLVFFFPVLWMVLTAFKREANCLRIGLCIGFHSTVNRERMCQFVANATPMSLPLLPTVFRAGIQELISNGFDGLLLMASYERQMAQAIGRFDRANTHAVVLGEAGWRRAARDTP